MTLLIISALVFFIIKLPPGDFLSNQIAELRAQGEAASAAKAEFLIKQYGLDRPVWEQYLIWIGVMPGASGFSGLLQGDWGWSFEFDKPVREVVGDALWLTLLVNLAVVIFIHVVAIPIAIYSATRQYSVGDYLATFIGYIGLATPSFLLALILLYYVEPLVRHLDRRALRSALCRRALDLAEDPVPALASGRADHRDRARRHGRDDPAHAREPARRTRQAVLRDRQGEGPAGPTKALLKYPFRMSLNPFIADIGNLLPHLVSGSVLVSLVLSLPTVGPILLERAEEPGPVPRRLHPDVRRRADGRRHAGLRPHAGLARSAHPHRRRDDERRRAPARRHYVDPAPFDPGATEPVGAESESFYRASSWQLMWWKFRRHKVARRLGSHPARLLRPRARSSR